MVKLGLGATLGLGTLAAIGITLFIFRDKISEFFSNISGGVEGAQEIGETVGILNENLQGNLTGIQDILSGKIFENFEFPTIPNPFENFEFPTIPNPFELGEGFTGLTDFLKLGIEAREESTDFTSTPQNEARADRGIDPLPNFPVSINDLVNRFSNPKQPIENFNVQTDIEGNTFQGGGVSFQGGTVTETPVRFLSLGQIIDRFDVSASKAASLRAEAIGFSPQEQAFLNQGSEISPLGDFASTPQVSDQSFQGLTPQEIALRLTGGRISNF